MLFSPPLRSAAPRCAPLRPAALAIAALGLFALADAPAHAQDLFVANGNTIARFAGTGPGTFSTTATTLSGGGLNIPEGLAFDARGDLFAANANGATLTEFAAGAAPGTFGAGTVIKDNLNGPLGLAFDARGDLFVTTTSGNSITEFAAGATPGTFGAGMTFATGLNGPTFLAFGPSVGAPVPEASTTVSLGLLLLGMGGVVMARRRRKA